MNEIRWHVTFYTWLFYLSLVLYMFWWMTLFYTFYDCFIFHHAYILYSLHPFIPNVILACFHFLTIVNSVTIVIVNYSIFANIGSKSYISNIFEYNITQNKDIKIEAEENLVTNLMVFIESKHCKWRCRYGHALLGTLGKTIFSSGGWQTFASFLLN